MPIPRHLGLRGLGRRFREERGRFRVSNFFEIGEFSRMETETGVESDSRPRDDEIQAFHNQIRAADAEKLEFVGEKVGLLSLIFFNKLKCV